MVELWQGHADLSLANKYSFYDPSPKFKKERNIFLSIIFFFFLVFEMDLNLYS